MIGANKRHQDIRIVVTGCGISPFGVSEHLPELSPRMHRLPARPIVHHAIFGKEFHDLVVEPVIDAIRVLVNEVDDLIFVDEPPDRGGFVSIHQSP